MIGSIAGDIIGSVHEHSSTKTKDFPLFVERCRFTDDTVLTIAVAKKLALFSVFIGVVPVLWVIANAAAADAAMRVMVRRVHFAITISLPRSAALRRRPGAEQLTQADDLTQVIAVVDLPRFSAHRV